MKTKITLCLLIVYVIAVNAQIGGRIVNEEEQPLEAANIVLRASDSTFIAGAASDAEGIFELKVSNKLGQSEYLLVISSVGYQTQVLHLKSIPPQLDLGKIIMQNVSLAEVTVTAKSQLVKTDKVLIFPSELDKKHASDGFGLLKNLMIPQIDIDLLSKEVTTRGKDVTLLINGRPVTKKEEITGLRPQDILRVEYNDMPTGFYAGNEAIIDFITRQYEFGGYLGVNGTQHFSYTSDNYMAMARMNHKKSEYSLGYSCDYLTDKDIHKDITELFIYPDSELKRTETGLPSLQKNKAHQVFFNYYYANNPNRFNLQIGYNDRKSPGNTLLSTQVYSGKDNFTRNLSDTITESNKQPYLSLYTYQEFKNKQSLYFSFNINRSKNYYQRHYEETDEENGINSIFSLVDENYLTAMTMADYTKSFRNGKSLDVRFVDFYRNTKSSYEDPVTNTEKLLTNEMLGFLFLNKQWQKLYLSFCLGGSYTHYEQSNYDKYDYFSFRPSLVTKYNINDQNSVGYSVYMDNSFPTLDLLTDIEQPIDFLQKRKGNPNLKLIGLLSNRLTYAYLTDIVGANINFEYYKYSPTIKNTVYYDGAQFIHSYESEGTFHLLSPGVGITLKLFEKKLNLKVNSGLSYYHVTGNNGNSETCWYINPSVQYLYEDFSLNVFYNSPRKGLSNSLNFWDYSERYGLSVSYNKNGLSLTAAMQNPFSTYKSTNRKSFDVYSSKSITCNSQNDHLFYIQFNYNFSFGRKHTYSNINSSQSSNSAILKGSKD
jgi:hypothetical protein